VRTVGSGPHNGLAARHAMDHDVQETADNKAEKNGRQD
jgi:hypothetical protein